jgi:sugar phosphate isomerase/epimerase
MIITGLGINGDGGHLGGSLSQLADDLAFFRQCGFDFVELAVDGLDVVVNGRLRQQQVAKVRDVLDGFAFDYAVHAPNRLNLAFPQMDPDRVPQLGLEQDVFVACLDFCAFIGARVLVYHSGLIALHEAAFGLDDLPDADALERAREREVSALRDLMPLAADRNVTVAMENRDPHPWEVATLRRAGLPADQLAKYHPGLFLADLVRQVDEVGHERFGLTLDFGHLYLTAELFGFDYLDAIRQAGPYVLHLHGSDNCGRLGGVVDNIGERIPYGEGDLHMPPGWGSIPLREALEQLPAYQGLFILEIRPRFRDHFAEAKAVMEAILASGHA